MTMHAHILEIDDTAAGILVREDARHVRFHAALPAVERLDRRVFRSARAATEAVAALVARPRPSPRDDAPDPGRDRTAELVLAAYGPFQTI